MRERDGPEELPTTPPALVVIPARLASTRLPEKALLQETGKPLVQHVAERAASIGGPIRVVVATDSDRIVAALAPCAVEVRLTSPEHPSGTDRVAEVARDAAEEIVVNLQGDEPEFDPRDIEALIAAMASRPEAAMGTLVHPDLNEAEQGDPSVVKAVVDEGWALDFRREPTPGGLRHIGVYAFRASFLQEFTRLPPSPRERERRLEQMRALDAGRRILAVNARHRSLGIDTPADYAAFVARWREDAAQS